MIGYVALGSNLGDRKAHLAAGLAGLRRAGIAVRAVSSVWETEPVDSPEPLWFLNAVARIETDLPPEEVLSRLLAIEREAGRIRGAPNAPRPLDLDLLTLGHERRDGGGLTLPHPRMWERAFVLAPLAEVGSELNDPATGLDPAKSLAALSSPSVVRKAGRLALPEGAPVYSRPS